MYLKQTIDAVKIAKKPLFQLSGGCDSLCALLLLFESGCKDFDVVWVNTGDVCSETLSLMDNIRDVVGSRFFEITSDSVKIRERYGIPSPIVRSTESNQLFKLSADDAFHVQPQHMCCYHTIMLPMHEFTVDGQYDIIIRGNRGDEVMKTPLKHLENDQAYTVAYPIYDWSKQKVQAFLDERNMLPPFYAFTKDGVDCTTCPAYWGNGYQKWLENTDVEKASKRREQIKELLIYISGAVELGLNEID